MESEKAAAAGGAQEPTVVHAHAVGRVVEEAAVVIAPPRLPRRHTGIAQAGYGGGAAAAYIVPDGSGHRHSLETNALCHTDRTAGATIDFDDIGVDVAHRRKQEQCCRRNRWQIAALTLVSIAGAAALVLMLGSSPQSSKEKQQPVQASVDATLQAGAGSCCQAMTASCIACSRGLTVAQVCLQDPTVSGCRQQTPTRGSPSPPAPSSPTAAPLPPPICCMAMTASCIACSRGLTVAQVCLQDPTISGCQRPTFTPPSPPASQRQVATVSLSVDISLFNADRQQFVSNFATGIGATLSVSPSRVVIVNVQPGSVQVQFYITSRAANSTAAANELSTDAAMALLSDVAQMQQRAQIFARFNMGSLTTVRVETRPVLATVDPLYVGPSLSPSPSSPTLSTPCADLRVPYCDNGICIRDDDAPFYSENDAVGIGWSHTKISDTGSAGLVHGPWGSEVSSVSTVISVPTGVELCRVSWRSWAIDSRDGEIDRVLINGVKVWESRPRQRCRDGWTAGPADFPNPWMGQRSVDVCYVDVTVDVACAAGSMLIEFNSGVNQHINNEAWAYNNLAVDSTPSYKAVLAEKGAVREGWSNVEVTDVGSAGLVHGPYGNDVRSVTKIVGVPTDATKCRVSWRSWAIDSRDGEVDRVFVDGALVWEKAGQWPCRSGWQTGPGDFPNPSQRGQRSGHVCYVDVSVEVVCSGTLSLEFRSAIDQAEENEAWAFSSVTVETPAPYRCSCSSGWGGDTCDTVATGAGVVIGRSSAAGIEGASACANVAARHEVRCCADRAQPRYQRRNGCSVWAESNFRSAGGCVDEATLERATQICAMDGARLCTVAELEADCTAGTGCGHDADLVWSSGQCSIPSAPPLVQAPPHAWTVLGNFRGGNRPERQRCAASSIDLHEVRCCSDHFLPGYATSSTCPVWGSSHVGPTGGCVEHVTLVTALAICHGDGARVCTVAEVQAGCGQGTGCGHDFDLVWTSDTCSPAWPSVDTRPPPASINGSCTDMSDLMAAIFVCDNAPPNAAADFGATCTNACISNLIACIDNPMLALVLNPQEMQDMQTLSRCCASPSTCGSSLVPASFTSGRTNTAPSDSCQLTAGNFSTCADLKAVTTISNSAEVTERCGHTCVQETLSCARITTSPALSANDIATLNAAALCCAAPALCSSISSTAAARSPSLANAGTSSGVCNIGNAVVQLASCTDLAAPTSQTSDSLCSQPCVQALLNCVRSPMLAIMASSIQLHRLHQLVTVC